MEQLPSNSWSLRSLLLVYLSVCVAAFDSWPSLNYYSFSGDGDSKTLSGRGSHECNFNPNDPSTVKEVDRFHDIGIIAGKHTNGVCYPWGSNSDADFLVEKGTLSYGGGTAHDAYKIHPAEIGATDYTASKPTLVFKFDAGFETSYSIYKVVEAENPGEASVLTLVDEISPVTADHYVLTSAIAPMNDGGVTTFYAVVPSNTDFSIWPPPSDGSTTRKATIFDEEDVALYAELFEEDGITPFDAATDYDSGPSSWTQKYGLRKHFTKVTKDNGGTDGVVWQDQSDDKIFVTWENSSGHSSVELPTPGDHYLAAAASNNDGHIIYITVSSYSNLHYFPLTTCSTVHLASYSSTILHFSM